MLFNLISSVKNFKVLQNEILEIVRIVGFKDNQIMCQTLNEDKEDFYTGIGSIHDLEYKDEQQYKFINKSFKKTYLEEIITDFKGCRTRILKLNPKTCYSIHRDPSPRIHIPIISNDQCWMIWPTRNSCLNMQLGFVYWTDTRKHHTFINCNNNIERIHLVMAVEE
jgi:hypothetical protein